MYYQNGYIFAVWVLKSTTHKDTNKYHNGMDKKLLTPYQRERLERDQRIYADYKRLMQGDGVRKVGVYSYLCDKYGLHSKNTIHTIRRRMEALENEQKQ